jgi:hypothetical protein
LCSGKDPLLTRQRDREADWAAVDLRIQEEQRAIAARMSSIKHKVLVLSGKGGVSTPAIRQLCDAYITSNLFKQTHEQTHEHSGCIHKTLWRLK